MIEIIETAALRHDATVVIDKTDGVWLTFHRPWYDVIAWVRWLSYPGKRSTLLLRDRNGTRVRVKAVRLTSSYVRM